MRIAVLGPGGVGGLIAGALDRAGTDVSWSRRRRTARGDRRAAACACASVTLGDFVAHPRAVSSAAGAGRRADRRDQGRGPRAGARADRGASPALVLPLLNGLDHLARAARALRAAARCSRGRSASRPTGREPGVVVHTSPFLLVEHGRRGSGRCAPAMRALADALARCRRPGAGCSDSEAQVMWSKLVRLNALACTTSAYDKLLGRDPRDAGAARGPRRGDRGGVRGRPGRGRARHRRRRGRSRSSSAPTRRSAARCSATSPPGARPSSTRSRARCCARPPATGCPARRSSGSSR